MNSPHQPKLAIIVPCYNEAEVLPHSIPILLDTLKRMIQDHLISDESFLCFNNNGSADQTWAIIKSFHQQHPNHIRGICLSRNWGHQSSLMSALYTIEADCYITIDADLQDDETAIADMVQSYLDGHDIVYGVRRERSTDTWFKRNTAQAFYKLMNLMGTKTIYNHADYRLMSRRAVHELRQYPESNVFLRGLVTELGFPTSQVYYDRKQREAGESKYPLTQMLRLAWIGITSFSNTPLKLSLILGLLTCAFSIFMLLYCLWYWMQGDTVAGWTSMAMLVSFFSGLQMLLLGIIGEYIGKIFTETKRRPHFIIQETLFETKQPDQQ
ncbi:glycosyltransferase family 2 protein [Akkermansia glycaniphila]|uniref:glycosyltransferase family 2 protein n=1 Tax=Akkermansia glycaniphila TaxID=1679444 RepID=UPI001C009C6E|nr:glycosyltransferase family 2 protein [Akkermansia glycaniphila]MBT9449827.1 glycosyltransferase family 2 protein [Akkermansia glycaniphila]